MTTLLCLSFACLILLNYSCVFNKWWIPIFFWTTSIKSTIILLPPIQRLCQRLVPIKLKYLPRTFHHCLLFLPDPPITLILLLIRNPLITRYSPPLWLWSGLRFLDTWILWFVIEHTGWLTQIAWVVSVVASTHYVIGFGWSFKIWRKR